MINFRLILFVLGILITVLGLFMLIPLLVEIIYYSSNKGNFFISFCLSFLVGISLVLAFKSKEKSLNIKDTLIITSISWPILCIFASIPFYLDDNLKKRIIENTVIKIEIIHPKDDKNISCSGKLISAELK